MATLTARQLIVTAIELNPEFDNEGNEVRPSYDFPVYEFENGLILVPSGYTHDYFVDSRDDIEPNGSAVVQEINETDETESFSRIELANLLADATNEFSYDSAIQSGWELIKSTK